MNYTKGYQEHVKKFWEEAVWYVWFYCRITKAWWSYNKAVNTPKIKDIPKWTNSKNKTWIQKAKDLFASIF